MNVSLPITFKEYVDRLVESGEYGTSSEYIRSLIREDQQRRVAQRLDELLLEGLNSGPPILADDAYWEAKQQALDAEL
jgi:antitoxin ParD1/3/4